MCYICCKSQSMLDAKDLRIGNLFNHFEDGILPIEEIKKDSDGFEGYYAVFRNGFTKSHVSYLTPIELTEEWLLRFGFEVKSASVIHNYSYNIGFFVLTNGLRNNISYDGYEIVYVHQLQNLFYSLTNTELKLKDEK